MEYKNKVELAGIYKSPRFNYNDKHKWLDFSIEVVSGKYKNFFRCIAWGDIADIINNNCSDGSSISISGYLVNNTYNEKTITKITVVEYEFETTAENEKNEKYEDINFVSPSIDDNPDAPF